MNLGLKNKVAVVMASSRGLGFAVAEALAREGARLAICSRDGDAIGAAAEHLRASCNAEVCAGACDVEDAAAIDAFARKVIDTYGTAHVLFTNAGGPPPGTVADVVPADYSRAVSLNLMSAINCAYAFLPYMKEQQWGRIIASTSITVKQPLPALALSNVSRVGVIAFIKSLAVEYAQYGITANAVAPGYIGTERVAGLLDARVQREGITREAAAHDIVANIPAGRMGDPKEFAALVAFLASERASYINGETILVDGGMYRGLM